MRVAVALSSPPLAEGSAQGRCAVALLRGLASHGVQVDAVAAQRPGASYVGVPDPRLPVTVVPTPETLRKPALYAAKLVHPRGELSRGAFSDAVTSAAGRADLLHLEETDTGWTASHSAQPRLLHVHHLAMLDLPLMGLRGSDPYRRAEEVYAEMRLSRVHPWLLASSPDVAARLQRMSPRSRVSLAPLALDPQDYPCVPLDGPPAAGLIGTADWPPTRSALQRLVESVWPRVVSAVPGARLYIAGRGSERLTNLSRDAGVKVLGPVPSAVSFLRGLSVLVYPVSRGSGMKVKVMEALASGLPVVTTPAGAEGISRNAGMVVEMHDDRLADAVVELLQDPLARAQRGAAARAHFISQMSPHVATEPLVDLYRRMLGG